MVKIKVRLKPIIARLFLRAYLTRIGICSALFYLGISGTAIAATGSAAFRAGDRWSAVGDSITHSGSYHAWVYLFYLTRYPDRPLQLTNVGIAGDTAAGGLRRMTWDILPTKPTIATVMFGMNDVGRALYSDETPSNETLAKRQEALDAYRKNLRGIVTGLQQNGARVVLFSPSPFDQTADLPAKKLHGVNEGLAVCAKIVRDLASESGAAYVDMHEPMTKLNGELQKADPKFTLTGADRIHPAAAGHLVMAYLFLKAQHAPAEVARLALSAADLHVISSSNGAATELRRDGAGIAFTWKAGALPFPIDPEYATAFVWVPFMAELNQEVLTIKDLVPGHYELRIDDMPVRTFSADEWSRGVNLAELPETPQYRQALEVLRLVKEQRHHMQETTRNLALVEHQCAPAEGHPYTLESIKPYFDERMNFLRKTQAPGSNLVRIYNLYASLKPTEERDRREAERLAEAARRAAQPVPHHYTLRLAEQKP